MFHNGCELKTSSLSQSYCDCIAFPTYDSPEPSDKVDNIVFMRLFYHDIGQ